MGPLTQLAFASATLNASKLTNTCCVVPPKMTRLHLVGGARLVDSKEKAAGLDRDSLNNDDRWCMFATNKVLAV